MVCDFKSDLRKQYYFEIKFNVTFFKTVFITFARFTIINVNTTVNMF